jgi:hypothetical protein
MTKETRMGRFEEYGTGFKADFDIRVGPARSAWDCRVFAGELRADVERVLGNAFEVTDDGRDPRGYRFWFADDDLSVPVFVDDPEEGWPWTRSPPMPCRSPGPSRWRPGNSPRKLYDGLAALGTYLLIALEEGGMPVAANFDIGDDW